MKTFAKVFVLLFVLGFHAPSFAALVVPVCDDGGDPSNNTQTYNPLDGTTGGVGVPVCGTGAYQWVVYTGVTNFDPSTLDFGKLIEAYGYGFFMLVPVWALCKGVEIILKMIRR